VILAYKEYNNNKSHYVHCTKMVGYC